MGRIGVGGLADALCFFFLLENIEPELQQQHHQQIPE
tara:strand:+ start:1801 stop:1911 length:111 start_codon:yes stop_codon:yes gene_type:complete